ncbi:MAG: hypothetical protein WC860_03670 [Candidatus Margulisiibacteriota bacterium]|jgi:hypothetical protein
MHKIISLSQNIAINKNKIKIDDIYLKKILDFCINLFKKHLPKYANITNEALLTQLSDPVNAFDRAIPRIEIHKALDGEIVGVQLSVPPELRTKIADEISQDKTLSLQLTRPGRSIIELSIKGITKALPIDYLNKNYTKVLKAMNYQKQPGFKIDAKKSKTLIISDGDGTIYGAPLMNTKNAVLFNTLGNSIAKAPLLEYLANGGVYALCTGANIETASQRILAAFPENKKELLSRVILISTSGATLNYFTKTGELKEYKPYRIEALNSYFEKSNEPYSLDAVYLGDEYKKTGNDYPAFKRIGFDRAILVAEHKEKDLAEELNQPFVGSFEKGSAEFLKSMLRNLKNAQKLGSVFSIPQIEQYKTEARKTLTS